MSRQLSKPAGLLPAVGTGLFRGSLAEPYDGIGQYIMVALAGSSMSAAYKGRIAAGDFGGDRIFPRGTPVTVVSNRGNLEVFLGNIPIKCDLFNRATDRPRGGWESGPYGPWLQGTEMMLPADVGPTQTNEYTYVEDGAGVMQYSPSPYNDPVMGLALPRTLPVKIQFTGSVLDYHGDVNFQLYVGPYYHNSFDSWITFSIGRNDDFTTYLDSSIRSDPPYDWPFSTGIGAGFQTFTETLDEASKPRRLSVEFDEIGWRGKTWHPLTEEEPDDWGIEYTWDSPVDPTFFGYAYIESQNFFNPVATQLQPRLTVDEFCMTLN